MRRAPRSFEPATATAARVGSTATATSLCGARADDTSVASGFDSRASRRCVLGASCRVSANAATAAATHTATTRILRRMPAGRSLPLAAALRELFERLPVDSVARDDRNAARGRRAERRLAGAAFEQRPLADERAGTDLGDLLAVDLDGEHAVEEQVEHVAGLALFDEHLVGCEALPLGSDAAAHDLSRELPLEVALCRSHDRRRVLVAPRSALAVGFAVPGLEVDRPGLVDELAAVVVDPMPRKGARADELVRGRAVSPNREGERRPRGRAVDAEERLAAHPARRRKAGPSADRLHEAHGILGCLRLGPKRLERDAREDDVLRAEAERRRPDERLAGLAVVRDPAVLDLDPRSE